MMSLFCRLLILLSVLLLCGCQFWPRQRTAQNLPLSMPEQWAEAGRILNKEPSGWLDSFADQRLEQLIAEGLRGNFSLQSAAARIRAASARSTLAGAESLPQVALDLSAARRKTTSNRVANNFSLTGSVRWEIDLWQRLAEKEQAALREAVAADADYQAVRLALAANIARAWFRLSEANLQAELAGQTVDSYRQSLRVVEEQYRRGLTSALDLRLARTALNNAEASLADRQRQYATAQRQLELLLGRYPAGQIAATEQLPRLSGSVPAGLPSGLLGRRPDLQAAGLRLQASRLRTSATQRNWLPGFHLTTTSGTASDRLYQLLDWDYLLWSLAASLSQTIFDSGQKGAERQLAEAQLDEQFTDYAEVVLNAFKEVEDALNAESSLSRQEQALVLAKQEAEEARVLAEQRYRQGLEGIITLLETQRRAFAAQSNSLSIKRQRLGNRIALHLALGGPLVTQDKNHGMMESP